ncbi:hypothetical protein Bca101_097111 [Brassica carinata]
MAGGRHDNDARSVSMVDSTHERLKKTMVHPRVTTTIASQIHPSSPVKFSMKVLVFGWMPFKGDILPESKREWSRSCVGFCRRRKTVDDGRRQQMA